MIAGSLRGLVEQTVSVFAGVCRRFVLIWMVDADLCVDLRNSCGSGMSFVAAVPYVDRVRKVLTYGRLRGALF